MSKFNHTIGSLLHNNKKLHNNKNSCFNKQSYPDIHTARIYAQEANARSSYIQENIEAYKCSLCDHYHIGHKRKYKRVANVY